MIRRIRENLSRQDKALIILEVLLKEEFAYLRGRQPQAVTATEFSIHLLMRQIVDERETLRVLLGGARMKTFLEALPEELANAPVTDNAVVIEASAETPPETPADTPTEAGEPDDPEPPITEAQALCALMASIDAREQLCARQAERNTELAFALMDQSQSLLEHLHEQIVPKHRDTYSAKGAMVQRAPGATILSGSL